ncbi:MAG: Iron-sulfur cluster carrier protein [Candidatus Argoarchaeum ethanivorans]|uniref:Iron-sulfur cluster carrier protein n=1 Tax=Candidatus Argoarchaeum ethanivorans TaxID=2608793 RepID=A0A811TEV9_9EURY|nr:MAG: Iron-sulfur cluster carrier protein [Candidatus Argoarchaeum ethanivorans]
MKKEEKEKEAMAQEKRLKERMGKIKHKIMVMSGKGGVGKTTVAVNLALTLAAKGYEVGIMDADVHGPNVPKMLGIEDESPDVTEEGIIPVFVPPRVKVMSLAFLLQGKDTPVIWRGPLKMGVIRQFLSDVLWGDLDCLIADLPPGTGDEPLSVAQLVPEIDGAIIVTTPQDVALLDSRKSVTFAKKLGMPVIGIIENMSGFKCPKCGETIDLFKIGGGERAAMDMGVPFLGRIPIEVNIVLSGDNGIPFVLEHESEAAQSFRAIVDNIEYIMKGE